jgi:hemerythrin superfamily protein
VGTGQGLGHPSGFGLPSALTIEGNMMSNDAIVVLKEDHKRIRALFKKFQASSDTAHAARAGIVDNIIQELTVHTYLENEVMYPEVRRLVPELEDDVLESYEEHHVADVLCMELMVLEPTDERFVPKTTVLIENVTHHIEEEEEDWFPKVRQALGRRQLTEIGEKMQGMRDSAPRHPAQPSALKKAADAVLR